MKIKIKFSIINNLLRLFLMVLTCGFISIFVFFLLFTIDVTANGQGTVQCRNWIDIKPEAQGILREMMVREGQWVEKGEILFSLEDRERDLEVKETELEIAELEIDIFKLEKKLSLSEQNISSEIKESKAILNAAIANYRIVRKGAKSEEINLSKSKIMRAKKQLKKSAKDYELAKAAYDLKVLSILELEQSQHAMNLAKIDLRLARDELSLLKNKYDADQISAAKAEVNCKQAILQKAIARKKELEIIRKDLESALKNRDHAEKKLSVLREQLNLTRITSPINGYVLTHDTEHLVGQAVVQGEVVLRIGDYQEYIIDCLVSENDFPLVKVGQAAKVQIKPFPKGEYKVFSAEVIRVGADLKTEGPSIESGMIDNVTGLLMESPSLNEGLFPVILRLHKPYKIIIFGDVYNLKPGFSAEVEIITRQERIAIHLLRKVLRFKGKLSTDNVHL